MGALSEPVERRSLLALLARRWGQRCGFYAGGILLRGVFCFGEAAAALAEVVRVSRICLEFDNRGFAGIPADPKFWHD